jgi:hypothetical protein
MALSISCASLNNRLQIVDDLRNPEMSRFQYCIDGKEGREPFQSYGNDPRQAQPYHPSEARPSQEDCILHIDYFEMPPSLHIQRALFHILLYIESFLRFALQMKETILYAFLYFSGRNGDFSWQPSCKLCNRGIEF